MQNLGDQALEINEYFKEYLRYLGLHSTLECFEADVKVK